MPETPGVRDDTHQSSARNAVPRAAGVTPTRGAQPSGHRGDMPELCARVSPEDLMAQLEAMGDWRAILDAELAKMAATTKRIGRLIRDA